MKTFTRKLLRTFYVLTFIYSAHIAKAQPAGALNFAGGDDVVIFPYNSSPWAIGNSFSIEMWLNPSSSGYQLLMYPGYGCSYCAGYVLSIGDDLTCFSGGGNAGKLVFQGANGKIFSDNTLTTGIWTHIAVTYDGQILKMYINGLLQKNIPMVVANVVTGGDRQLGCDNGGCGARFAYSGSIDEFRIWSGARTQYEIQTYKNCEFTTTPASLTANYHFNHGTVGANNSAVNTLVDASASAVNGNVSSFLFALNGTTSNWVAGAIANGYTLASSPTVGINVQGNSTTISDGDNTPSTTDHTDFNGALTRTFVIQNTAAGTLNPAVYLTGPDANCFSITTLPAQSVVGVGSTSFVITMITGGTKSATVNINSNDGTIPVHDFVITATSTKYEAINFDGTDDNILIPKNIGDHFTIEFWMRSTQTPTFGLMTQWYEGAGLIDGDVGGFNDDFGVSLLGSKIAFGVGTGGGDYTIFSQSSVNTGQWVHVATTRNTNTGEMKIYINGVLETTYTGPCCYKGAASNLRIGSLNTLLSHGFYNGDLDEVRIWNTIRTQSEIQNFMNAEIPNAATGLFGNYHFNQGTASGNASVTTLVDNSTQNYLGYYYNGTLSNFALSGTTSNWIAPGNVTTGYALPASSLAIINVKGNNTSISNNASTTNTLDFTNFQSNSTRTFVIENTGTGILNINAVQIAGSNATEFSVTVLPSSTLTTSGTTSFVVAFTPTAGGIRSASIHIASTDNSTALYSFAIEGSAPTADALGFDGSNDYAYRTILTTNTIDITMQAKVYWYGSNTLPQMVMYNGHSSIRGSGIYVNANGGLQILYGGVTFTPYNYTLTPNVWTSLSAVVKNGSVECYVNGILVSVTNVSNPGVPNSAFGDLFTVASNQGGTENFSGRIDEVRYWDKALTQCEIQTYLNCEIPGSMPNLLANYHFNQGAHNLNNAGITNIIDASGNGNDLTLLYCSLTGTFENWVSPGGVVAGYTITSPPNSSISLSGNGNPISNNTTTVSTTNSTDFGFATTSSATFVIQNTTGTLNIGTILITGANSTQYSITTPPASSLLIGAASTSFVVSFTAGYGGPQNATVNIYNNDCSDPIYNFAISASAPIASAVDLDGVNDYVGFGANANVPIGNSPYTLEAKIKPFFHGNNGIIGWGDYVTTNQSNALRLGTGGSTGYIIYNYWFNNDLYVEVPNLADGNWHHVAATYDGTTRSIYLDGALMGADIPGALAVANNANMRIGSTCLPCGGEFFGGKIDEVRVWNYARTECDIRTFKDCEIPTTASGLVLNQHFNQGSANLNNGSVNVAFDASANGLNGSLTNMTLTGTTSNWASPGSVVNGYTLTSAQTQSISVAGNGNPVTYNSSTVSTTNFTDFDIATTRTFVIQNSGSGTLSIGVISLSGLNASEFSITVLPATSTLVGAATTSFVVAFTPTAGGLRNATLNISNNDCAKPIFNFAIQGTAPLASALNFDGADDFISIAPSTGINGQFSSNRITLEGWFYPTSTNTSLVPMLVGEAFAGDNTVLFQMSLINTTILRAGFFDGNWNDTNTTISLNTWQHFAATYDQQRLNIYVNGILMASKSYTSPLPIGTESWYIGRRWDSFETYGGNMDDIRIWNTARTQCEIQTFMNCEIPSGATGLVANYHFNQGSHNLNNTSASTLLDAAGTYTATLNNFVLTSTSSNWFAPSIIANGFTTSIAPTSSIGVTGNSNPVTYNSTTVSTVNHTDFGSVASRTFVIANSIGSSTLNIGVPYLSGVNASEFSLTVLPASSLNGVSSTSFVVAFTPTTGGLRNATVNINSNDCGKPIFRFAIQGAAPTASALTFDGIDDYIDAPSTGFSTGNNDMTFEFWVRPKSAQTGHRWITSLGTSVSGSLMTVGYDGSNGNKIRVHHFGPDLIASTASVTPNVWTHVAVNYRGADYTSDIFINGVFVETLSFGAPLTIPVNPVFQIGTYVSNSSYCPDMGLDELRVWNRALCQQEIQNNLNCEITTTAPGLVANYHFNQGALAVDNSTVTTLSDVSGSLNTGTLSGFSFTGTASNWSGPGAVNTGSNCSIYLYPEINLVGNGQNISDGDITPSTTDNTDFGSVCANTVVVKTFTIQNTGTGTLSVNTITVSGIDATSFSVSAISPASPIAAAGSSTFAITFTPTSSGVKNATIHIPSNDCDEASYDVAITGTANALPTVSVSTSHSIICYGFTTSVSGSGANTYTWTGGTPTVTDGVAFSPTITTNYTLSGRNTVTGCTSSNVAVQGITVNPIPTVTANTTSSLVCNSGTVILSGSGADTYTWNGGTPTVTNGIVFNPTITTSYTLSGTYTLTGCNSTNTSIQTVSVNPTPTVSISNTNTVVCLGGAPSLTANGAVSYTWNPGGFTTSVINPTPALTTTYTLTGISLAGCTSTNLAQQTISVNPLPAVTATATSYSICLGGTVSVAGGGANTYVWTGGIQDNLAFSPSGTTSYTVTGTDLNNCQNTTSLNITVDALPSVTANITSTTVCIGTSLTLSGSGANTYTWTGGILDGQAFAPAVNDSYTLTGISNAGCTSTNVAIVTVSVNPLPTVFALASKSVVCAGELSTLSGSGAVSYTWSDNVSDNVAFTPSLSNTYTVTGTDANTCQNSTTVNITVNALPVLTVTSTKTLSCEAETTTLSVSGANTYTWNTSETTSEIAVSPTLTTSYTVNALATNGCSNTAVFTQSVNSCNGLFTAVASHTNVSCATKKDGKISINVTNTYTNSQLSYVWSGANLCPTSDCSELQNLDLGSYAVTVRVTYTLNNILVKQDSIIIDSLEIINENGPCELKVYNGVTPNNDGSNDIWQIENIEQFPNNKVLVFNRWGEKVFEIAGYNNLDKSWPLNGDTAKLVSSTYFYIIDPGDGSKLLKGWVELIKN